MTDLVFFSGGLGSWAAAKLRRASHPQNDMILLFADTKFEDGDLYRFLPQAAANVGAPLVRIADGRDIWQVFRDSRMLGNSRFDPCSRILKREACTAWRDARYTPDDCTLILGYGPEERSRIVKYTARCAPWTAAFPVAEAGLTGAEILLWVQREGLDPPRLYDLGFEHNNCKGGCIKAGIGTFVHLYRTLPAQYAEWESGEQSIRDHLGGKEVAILTDRRHGTRIPLTLATLRERIDSGERFPMADRFACGCMGDQEAADSAPSMTDR